MKNKLILWIPPIFLYLIKLLLPNKKKGFFKGPYDKMSEAIIDSVGYDGDKILKKVLRSTKEVKSGKKVYERDGILFDKIEYSWEVLASLLWVASQEKLCVIDIGGSLGTSYFQNKKFIDHLDFLEWNIIEQPHFVKAGIKHIQDKQIKFYSNIQQCLKFCNPNVVLVSSSLQYMNDLEKFLDDIINIDANAVIFDRTIIQKSNRNKLYVQHAPDSIGGSYPCYAVSENWLIKKMGGKYKLIEHFESLDFPELLNINAFFKGFIFKKEKKYYEENN